VISSARRFTFPNSSFHVLLEVLSILFLTKYDNKSTLKNRLFRKQLKIEQNTAGIEADFEKYSAHIFDFRLR